MATNKHRIQQNLRIKEKKRKEKNSKMGIKRGPKLTSLKLGPLLAFRQRQSKGHLKVKILQKFLWITLLWIFLWAKNLAFHKRPFRWERHLRGKRIGRGIGSFPILFLLLPFWFWRRILWEGIRVPFGGRVLLFLWLGRMGLGFVSIGFLVAGWRWIGRGEFAGEIEILKLF